MSNLMKIFLFLLTLLVLFLLYNCWNKTPNVSCTSPLFVSANADALMDTYRDLVVQLNTRSCNYDNRGNPLRISDTFGDYHCTFSAMPAKGYLTGAAGYVSFTSVYWYRHNVVPSVTLPFRTQWFSDDADVRNAVCKDCVPVPIVNPLKIHAHSFQAVLVPTDAYKSSGLTVGRFSGQIDTDPTNPFISIAVKANDIKKINDVTVECEGGYMSTKLPAQYHNLKSSVGVVCEVIRLNGDTINCYVFNNEDEHRIIWKEKK